MRLAVVVVLAAGSLDLALQKAISPALPALQAEFNASATSITWVVTGFAVVSAIALALAGPVGDRYGRRRVFLWSLFAFACGSIVCALAQSIGVLIAGRVLQGLGGGIAALAPAIAKDHLTEARVPRAVGFLVGAAGIGGVVGLIGTGLLVDHVSTASVFWVLCAVSLSLALAVWAVVPESPRSSRGRIDWLGALLLAGGLGAFMLAISKASAWQWGSSRVQALLAGSLLLLITWALWERKAPNPLVDLDVLLRRSIWSANVGGFLFTFACFVPFTLVPLIAGFPQTTGYGLGLSSTQVALVLLPGSAGVLVAGIVGGRLITFIGARWQACTANVCVVASYVAFLAVPWTAVGLASALVPLGLGLGLGLVAIVNLALRGSSAEEAGVTSGVNALVRTIGQALGPQAAVAVAVAVPVVAPGIPSEAGFQRGFVFGLLATFVALVSSWFMPSSRADPLVSDGPEPRTNEMPARVMSR